MKDVWVYSITSNKQAPRLYLQEVVPEAAQMSAGTKYEMIQETDNLRLVLRPNPEGTHVVSRKEVRGKEVPLIDLNSNKTLGMFSGFLKVRVIVTAKCIYIMPLASELKMRQRLQALCDKLNSNSEITMGSLAHGIGVLSNTAHHALKELGLVPKLDFAVDIWDEALEQARRCNDAWDQNTKAICMGFQELMQDEYTLSKIGGALIWELGIPCTAHSQAAISKKKLACPEADESVGHLAAPFLALASRGNPVAIVLENVPNYAASASMHIIRNQLRDMRYVVHETILKSEEWGALEARERLCMVAVTEGIEFSFPQPEEQPVKMLGEILEEIPLDDPKWREVQHLKDKEVRDKALGKGFSVPYLTPSSTRVPTIRAQYQKAGSCDARVLHPVNPNKSRLLTPTEHCLVKGISPSLVREKCDTTAHMFLGQSICPGGFKAIFKSLAQSLVNYVRKQVDLIGVDPIPNAA